MDARRSLPDRWNSLKSAELADFQRSGTFCDVTINIGARQFSAHRAVLAAGSPYFKAMFSGEMRESEANEVAIGDIEGVEPETMADTFQQIVHFIYSSKDLSITTRNICDVIAGANFFQVNQFRSIHSTLRFMLHFKMSMAIPF